MQRVLVLREVQARIRREGGERRTCAGAALGRGDDCRACCPCAPLVISCRVFTHTCVEAPRSGGDDSKARRPCAPIDTSCLRHEAGPVLSQPAAACAEGRALLSEPCAARMLWAPRSGVMPLSQPYAALHAVAARCAAVTRHAVPVPMAAGGGCDAQLAAVRCP